MRQTPTTGDGFLYVRPDDRRAFQRYLPTCQVEWSPPVLGRAPKDRVQAHRTVARLTTEPGSPVRIGFAPDPDCASAMPFAKGAGL